MDFLQRLAPSREGDGSRAVAALPSRFAAGGPLRAPIGPRQPEHDLDEGLSLAVDTAARDSAAHPRSAPPPTMAAGPRRPAAALRLAPPATSGSGDGAGAAPTDEADLAPVRAGLARSERVAQRPSIVDAPHGDERPSIVDALRGDEPRGDLALHPFAPPRAAEAHRAGRPPVAPLRTPAPLSAASLAHRVPDASDEPSVVHVSIGRIEVVANVTPPPAARRAPAPRQPTVPLADYLRGDRGGRR